jgi:hypothetical protein
MLGIGVEQDAGSSTPRQTDRDKGHLEVGVQKYAEVPAKGFGGLGLKDLSGAA